MPTRGIYSDVTLPYLTLPSQQPNPFYLLQQVNNLLVYKFLSLQNTTLFLFLSELMDLFKLPSLFCDTLATAKENEGVHFLSGPPCCLRQYSKRVTLETLGKNRESTIFERYHLNHVHRMPLPSYWWQQNFRGGCAQQRLETGLPLSPLLYPFIPMTLTDSWPCREVLPLP